MKNPDAEQQRPYRVCQECGRLTPSNTPWCVECGLQSVEALAAAQELQQEQSFARALRTRRNPATYGLILANVVVFLSMGILAGTFTPEEAAYRITLLNFGAKLKVLVDLGEYWRLVTPVFLHIGILHLVVNMYSLYFLGMEVERLFGTARFLVLYLLSGLGGSIGSYYLLGDSGVMSAGASGAIFGLFGVLVAFSLRYRAELPGLFREVFSIRQLMPVLALNLGITFMIPAIDKGGHLGGLFAGFLLTLAVPYLRPGIKRENPLWYVAAAICVVTVFASFTAAFSTKPRTRADLAELMPTSPEAVELYLVEPYNAADEVRVQLMASLAKAADKQAVAPDVAARARTAAANLRVAKGIDARSKELFDREAALFDRGADLLAGDRALLDAAVVEAYQQDHDTLEKDWDTWFEAEATKYGLTRTKNDSPGGEAPQT